MFPGMMRIRAMCGFVLSKSVAYALNDSFGIWYFHRQRCLYGYERTLRCVHVKCADEMIQTHLSGVQHIMTTQLTRNVMCVCAKIRRLSIALHNIYIFAIYMHSI